MAEGWTVKMKRKGYLIMAEMEIVVGREKRWIRKKCRDLNLPVVERVHKYKCPTTHQMRCRRWHEYPQEVASILLWYTLQLDWRRIAQQHHLNVPDLYPSLNSRGRFDKFSVKSAPKLPGSSLTLSTDSAIVQNVRDLARKRTQTLPSGRKLRASIWQETKPDPSSNS